ncbi:helix-turn-helix domain-containing protein [Herbiconiux sp. UC225_62]|uniref:helix-turn-helix domain-containing protein n=1 Tax=Herbiconiux sp. UC225_62 TaxID=3350168 RepID=UPI0036D23F8A
MSEQRNEVGEYLRARRAIVQPEDVGIEREASRRVAGLRREEVARLAGISPEYYLRLEQGRDRQPSNQVVNALGRALLLDAESTDYLRRLAQGGLYTPFEDASTVDDSVLALLDHWSHTPAFVMNRNQDILVSNPLACALGPGYMEPGANLVHQIFSAASREHAADWERTAHRVVAQLRLRGDPDDPRLQEIVGTLSMKDPDFPAIWARHDTASQRTGVSRHYIDPIGWVEFNWQNLDIPGSTHVLVTFWADPGSPAAAAGVHLAARVQQGAQLRTSAAEPPAS